jgi:hypothetical protein
VTHTLAYSPMRNLRSPCTSIPSSTRVWWQYLYSSKCHSLGLQVQSDAAKEVFPHKGDSGLLSNSRGSMRLVPFPCSLNNLQQRTNNFVSPS